MEGIDLTDLDNFANGFPHELFDLHRRVAPVWWHEPTSHTPDGVGFWSVATHAEASHVLRHPDLFSSERGGTLLQDLDVAGSVLTMMDDPRHARIRRLVSMGLTPRMVARLEDELRRRTRALLDAVPDGEPFDVVEAVASELPMQVICILLGVPESDRHELWRAVAPIFDIRTDDASRDRVQSPEQQAWLFDYAARLIADKRANPTDDMLSIVVHATLADVDPPRLSDLELFSFFFLLFSAGSDTTRNAITGGLLALIEHPSQLAALRADGSDLGIAIEEMLRWTTPSSAKRRTATATTDLGGHTISPGDKVLFWEASANRDELVFADPHRFDVGRDPNPHLSFGHGVHYCLGANLARLELRVVFEELLATFDGYEVVEPPEWTRSNRHTGIRRLCMRVNRSP